MRGQSLTSQKQGHGIHVLLQKNKHIFNWFHLLIIVVLKDRFYKAYGTLPTKALTDFDKYVTAT